MWRLTFFIFFMLPTVLYAVEPAELIGVRITSSPTASRFIFILNKKTQGKVNYLPGEKKLLVEFINTKKIFNIAKMNLRHANVQTITTKIIADKTIELRGKSLDRQKTGKQVTKTVAQTRNHQTVAGRVIFVFSLTGKIKWKIRFLKDKKESGSKLQLDIISISSKESFGNAEKVKRVFKTDVLKTFATLKTEMQKKIIAQSKLVNRTKFYSYVFTKPTKQKFNVIIDAGHGGLDPGARGNQGAEEKNIVLAIAKQLALDINRSHFMRATLTRSSDVYVPLRQRLALARKEKADLFVAIHADAFFNNISSGASVYALSPHGATTEAARWLAKRDNYSELGGVELDALKDRSPLLRSVLIDLAQTATIRDSLRLGNKVLDALEDVSSLHYKHVAQAPFVVLKSPDIPSVLVETGFISNPWEEKRLVNQAYQKKLASALYRGITKYIQQYATRGE